MRWIARTSGVLRHSPRPIKAAWHRMSCSCLSDPGLRILTSVNLAFSSLSFPLCFRHPDQIDSTSRSYKRPLIPPSLRLRNHTTITSGQSFLFFPQANSYVGQWLPSMAMCRGEPARLLLAGILIPSYGAVLNFEINTGLNGIVFG